MDIVFNGVRDDVGAGVEADDGLATNVKFNAEEDALELMVDFASDDTEALALELVGQVSPVDFMAHALHVLFQPLFIEVRVVEVTTALGQVGQQGDDPRAEAALGQQVHFELFDDDQLVIAGDVQRRVVVGLAFRLDQLHAQSNRFPPCLMVDILFDGQSRQNVLVVG